jgi:hypothetical protein
LGLTTVNPKKAQDRDAQDYDPKQDHRNLLGLNGHDQQGHRRNRYRYEQDHHQPARKALHVFFDQHGKSASIRLTS